ncbi:type II toxin-antitoxin system VapC family toxin [Synechocystis sp. PCC 7509]|uniref:type II toxin-antitoxin system VapC family toxin n=1 Tax=Synechocystis sp. PCC 7509 TaxID=927677 RepID=UPI0002F5996A|nr:type II toxin-antitoxin system VapC family toxin [Synechocystis sp. PCC 7509]
MNGSYLLDTNIVIALFADEIEVKNSLAKANEVFISSITVGELYYGAKKSARSTENLERIKNFVASITVLGCDLKTAYCYGEVKNKLRFKGKPLPENDIWIAAITLQYNLTLVTRDAHFREVENLQTITW